MKYTSRAFALGCAMICGMAGKAAAQDDYGKQLLAAASPVLQALCRNELAPLGNQPLGGLPYLQAVVTPLHDQSLSWRIPPEVRLFELDPLLPRALNTRMLTDREFHSNSMGFGLELGLNAITGFARARNRNVEDNTMDPASELTALMQGIVGGAGRYGTSIAGAERDADVMIALLSYPETIDAFRSCYDGLRAAVLQEH